MPNIQNYPVAIKNYFNFSTSHTAAIETCCYLLSGLFFKSGAYELKQFDEISVNIMRISLESKKKPYNSFYFIKKEHSILFNLYNQILSIFSLDNFQKMTICYNCSKIDLDVLF